MNISLIKLGRVLFFLCLPLIISCGKNELNPNDIPDENLIPGEEQEVFMTATVGGEPFKDYLTYVTTATNEFNRVIYISGQATNTSGHEKGIQIILYLPPDEEPTPKSYPNDDCLVPGVLMDGCSYLYYGINTGGNTTEYFIDFSIPQSPLSITSVEFKDGGYISGTFEGQLIDDEDDESILQIEDGEFLAQFEF